MRVLVVEDKARMAALLQRALQREGYQTSVALDGESALAAIAAQHLHALVLDLMLPGLDGFGVLARMRQDGLRVPTILLTARDSTPDIVRGLDLGADDYLTKPFDLDELLARLRALTRRPPALLETRLRLGSLHLRSDTHSVEVDGVQTALTPTEFALLELLMRRAGQVVRKETLTETGWGPNASVNENTLHVFIRTLRHKIQANTQPVLLHTVRGVGYMLKAAPAA